MPDVVVYSVAGGYARGKLFWKLLDAYHGNSAVTDFYAAKYFT